MGKNSHYREKSYIRQRGQVLNVASMKEQLENIYGSVGEERENQNIIEQNGARHDIATTAAYLIGVSDKFFDDRPDLFDKKIIKRLSLEKRARVVRNLCMIRTAMFRYNYAIYTQMMQEKKGLYGIEEIPQKALSQLEADDIFLVKNDPKVTKNDYTIEVNKLIKGRINDCKSFFPDWMSWEYVKNMFIMPNGTEEFVIKAASDEFLANKSFYR